jgi:hypothetical protein
LTVRLILVRPVGTPKPPIHVLHWCMGISEKSEKYKNNAKMPFSIKEIENMTHKSVCASPFTKIHGHPPQHNYEILKNKASDLASELDDITYDWSCSNTGKEYGLLAEIIGKYEYDHLTNLTWVQTQQL